MGLGGSAKPSASGLWFINGDGACVFLKGTRGKVGCMAACKVAGCMAEADALLISKSQVDVVDCTGIENSGLLKPKPSQFFKSTSASLIIHLYDSATLGSEEQPIMVAILI